MTGRDEKLCPRCGEPCERDMVDVGIGEVPSGPWGCPACFWVEPKLPDLLRDYGGGSD